MDRIRQRSGLGWAGAILALVLALWLGKDSQAMEKLLFATDMHYLSEKLTDYGPIFDRLMSTGDGKLTEYSKEIMDALFEEARKEGIHTLVLGGDLTFNGEYQSLLDLKEMFERAEEEGMRVLVIPGNHDIAYPYACSYFGTKAVKVKPVSQKDFVSLMGSFGYDQALYKDETSFSYVFPLSEKEWLLFLDANTETAPGRISEETLSWMQEVLPLAGEARVTAVSHQNVLPHSSLMTAGFVLGNGKEVAQALREAGVSLVLSGHSHLQDTSQEEGLVDICTESLAVSPLRYAIVTLEEGQEPVYEKRSLPIRQKEARDRFYQVVGLQVEKSLEGKNLPPTQKRLLISFAQEANLAYFAGEMTSQAAELLKKGERWKLWREKASDTFWYIYMRSYLH